MQLKKFAKSVKAISPVIATLMLLLLAVAAGVVVYAYVMGWLGGSTKGSSTAQGELSLDYAVANATSNTINAYVRNVGGVSLTVEYAYVSNTQIDITDVTIAPEAVGTVTISVSSGLTAGTTYEVKLTCDDGTSLVFNEKAESL